ncbi:hypothetical protein [Spirosoma endbachense]|uniref:DUF5056 domain-containing protein n=1 Tax=Spirosoma endbachense TaxID=2666025 RepID=A0A6P1VX83_9BACT|nr:hypothetical protein [Spirosoma endbachense]QHV96692.1 hypothetical protein GJR95_17490 [Spirosoma endbachense]
MMMDDQEDERIQQWLENDLSASPDELGSLADAKTYKRLFEALKTEPEAGMLYGFSAKIERQIFRQKQRSRQVLLYGLLSLVAIILLAGGILMGQNQVNVSGLLSLPTNYQWPLIFGTSVLVLVQLLEHQRLKKQWLRH